MKISLLNAGKRFNREWIFRNLNYDFLHAAQYAITGANGSGKSTLLQIIAGASIHSEGEVKYLDLSPEGRTLTEPFKFISLAAPYIELIEEMTAVEFLSFHSKFKPLIKHNASILEEVGLATAAFKQIRYFSSGMKQRLKLAQAFYSDTPVLLLDEPTTNLDKDGIRLYNSLINKYAANRTIIVSSNDEQEYGFCTEIISIADFK